MEESISLEETNRIRASLGLKPIPVPTAVPTHSEKQSDSLSLSETNKLRISLGLKPIVEDESKPETTIEDLQSQERQKAKDEKLRQSIETAKFKAEKRRRLNVANSLLDEDEDQDTSDWLSKISVKKDVKTKKKSRKVQHEDDDLSGVKVGHSVDELDALASGDVILTLKDKSILDEDDELESDLLVQKRKLEKEMAEKLRTNRYDINGEEKTRLDLYDEKMMDDDNGFVINGGRINVDKSKEVDSKDEPQETKKRKIQFSLEDLDDDDDDDDEPTLPSDYVKSKPIKMKKLKKKSKSQQRSKDHTDEDGDLEVVSLRSVELQDADNAIDDDYELQARLSLKRAKLQKKNKKTPEQLAAEIEEEKESAMDLENDKAGGVVIDENTEFLSSFRVLLEDKQTGDAASTGDPAVEQSPAIAATEDTEMVDQSQAGDEGVVVAAVAPAPEPEVNFGGGLASTLSFLKSKNVVHTRTPEQLEAEKRARQLKKEADLKKLQLEIEKRAHEEALRQDPRYAKMSKKEREEFVQAELEKFKETQNAREMAEKLKNYNPDVNLKYVDEFGHEMGQKEAYKHLSHAFHGNGKSKSKIAKKKKKLEEETKGKYKESLLGPGSAGDNSEGKAGVRIQ